MEWTNEFYTFTFPLLLPNDPVYQMDMVMIKCYKLMSKWMNVLCLFISLVVKFVSLWNKHPSLVYSLDSVPWVTNQLSELNTVPGVGWRPLNVLTSPVDKLQKKRIFVQRLVLDLRKVLILFLTQQNIKATSTWGRKMYQMAFPL